MGRLDKTDKRFDMLRKLPRVRDGRVVFRKKPTHLNKYVITIFEAEDAIHWVWYSFRDECMSFVDFPRP